MNLAAILSKAPQKGKEVFIAPNATVIGNVSLGDESSVWFGAVLRADSDKIIIGDRTNIQDNAVVHVDPNCPSIIGNDCIVGHLALVHGAIIGNNVLIGMHSTVLNNAHIGEFSIIGANALITTNTIIPPYSLVVGSPGKIIKTLDDRAIDAIKKNASVYVTLAKQYINFYNS
jgi:carbonic anhydrase/acetyltransferase-like protein (isoleucine patch superfamily)